MLGGLHSISFLRIHDVRRHSKIVGEHRRKYDFDHNFELFETQILKLLTVSCQLPLECLSVKIRCPQTDTKLGDKGNSDATLTGSKYATQDATQPDMHNFYHAVVREYHPSLLEENHLSQTFNKAEHKAKKIPP